MKDRKDTQTSINFGNMPTSRVESSTPIVKIVNKSNNTLPEYETEGSAGQDIRAFLKEEMVIKPFERVLIPTGLYIELAPGYEAQIRPRSGLALKKGLTFPNSPGTIDSDYRGEIGIIATNISDTPIVIENGDRIAQMVVTQYSRVVWNEVKSLSDTARGDGGFGHTGV